METGLPAVSNLRPPGPLGSGWAAAHAERLLQGRGSMRIDRRALHGWGPKFLHGGGPWPWASRRPGPGPVSGPWARSPSLVPQLVQTLGHRQPRGARTDRGAMQRLPQAADASRAFGADGESRTRTTLAGLRILSSLKPLSQLPSRCSSMLWRTTV
jgi:hypothetical protein